jgi:hypothetical protein
MNLFPEVRCATFSYGIFNMNANISFSNSNRLAFVVHGRTAFLNIMYMNFRIQRMNEL